MIRKIRHRGLKRLFERGDAGGISSEFRERLENILGVLDAATSPLDLDLPGFRLHPLKGDRTGFWAVSVTANRRVVFRFIDGAATDIDFLDYH